MATGDTGKTAGSSAAPSPSASATSAPASAAPQTVAAQRAGMVQALEELARGERTATKLEDELRAFEAKLDNLLTSLGMTEADLEDIEDDTTAEEEDKTAEEEDKTVTSEDGKKAS